jgi:TldD protein
MARHAHSARPSAAARLEIYSPPMSIPPVSRRRFLATGTALLAASYVPDWAEAFQSGATDDARRAEAAEAALARAAALGASYADIRVNRYRRESIATRERQVQNVSRSTSYGLGLRVLVDGTWGFAATNVVDPAAARAAAEQAVAIARGNARLTTRKVELANADKVVTTWANPIKRDPFEVPLETKIAFLMSLNEAALAVTGVTFVSSQVLFVDEQKYFASSEGSRITQRLVRTYPQFTTTAADRAAGDFQTRAVVDRAKLLGYEYVEEYPWLEDAEKAGHEVVEKLKAKPAVPGRYDIVVDPSQLFLAIHESVGHSTELDRALGWEANMAGTSFLKPGDAGKLRFGSNIVNLVGDRTQPGGLGTTGFDDEGVKAERWHLVRDGMFVDWQTTRELAPLVGQQRSHGCLHADDWSSVPFPRMPNVSLEPAATEVTLDDLFRDIKRGLFVEGRGVSSIDQQRYNFQFGGAVIREITNGKLGAMVRDAAYQSRTPDFWASCDGLGGPATYRLWGTSADGKGEPGQTNAVSHGCPPARFRNVTVLNTGAA